MNDICTELKSFGMSLPTLTVLEGWPGSATTC